MLAPGMTSMAQVVGGDVVDLTAPTPPAAQSLASSATTASVTFTHPGAPAGVTYALTVTDEADAAVTPDSGSGLGAWVFPVASDKAYAATIEATGTDGQTSQSTALVKVAAAGGAAPGWDTDYFDLTDLDVATLTNGATTGVTRATVAVCRREGRQLQRERRRCQRRGRRDHGRGRWHGGLAGHRYRP
jgi:hypothetical protein